MAKQRNPSGERGDQSTGSSSHPDFRQIHIWQIQAVRDLLVVAAAFGILWLGYVLRSVTVPLLIALLLAYLFEPIIQWLCRLERGKLSRVRAVTLLMITVGSTVLIVLLLTVPLVVSQGIGLVQSFRPEAVRERLATITPHVPEPLKHEWTQFISIFGEPGQAAEFDDALPPEQESPEESLDESGEGAGGDNGEGAAEPSSSSAEPDVGITSDEPAVTRVGAPSRSDASNGPVVPDELDQRIEAIVDRKLAARTTEPARSESSGFWAYVATGAQLLRQIAVYGLQFLTLFVLIPFYFFFLSSGYPKVVSVGHSLLPARNRDRAVYLIAKMDRVVSAFVRGRIVICFITGVIFSLGWWLCGVPYAWAIGMITGAFFIVPYLAGVGLPLAIGFLFFDQLGDPTRGELWWLWSFVNPIIVFAIVQVIETYILTPKIAGGATNLDPVTVVVAVLAGGSLLGVYGMLLAIPFAACGKILLLEVLLPKIDSWLKGERPDPLPIKTEGDPAE